MVMPVGCENDPLVLEMGCTWSVQSQQWPKKGKTGSAGPSGKKKLGSEIILKKRIFFIK